MFNEELNAEVSDTTKAQWQCCS